MSVYEVTHKKCFWFSKKQFFRSSKAVVSRWSRHWTEVHGEFLLVAKFVSARLSLHGFWFGKHKQRVDAGLGWLQVITELKYFQFFRKKRFSCWTILIRHPPTHITTYTCCSQSSCHCQWTLSQDMEIFLMKNSFSFRQPATIDLWMTLLMKQQELASYKLTKKRSQEHKLD